MWRYAREIEKTETATSVKFDNGDIYILTNDGYLTARHPNGVQFTPERADVDGLMQMLGKNPMCLAELPNGWKLI